MKQSNFTFCLGLFLYFLTYIVVAQNTKYPKIKEDRKGRLEYEYQMLINPNTKEIPDNIYQKELLYIYSSDANLQPSLKGNDRAVRVSNWDRRGPYNVGGRTRALALDATNEDIILAGGVSGGMWRSTDAGATWTKTTASNQLHSVTCITQDTRTGQTDTWYYGTGEFRGNSARGGGNSFYRGDGVFKSTDNGVTWTLLSSTTGDPTVRNGDFQYIYNVIVNPINGDVYAATFGGIQQSTDGGTTWTQVLDGGNGDYTDIAITSNGVLYATISDDGSPNKGIFRSTDGTNWVDITPTTLPSVYDRIVLDIAPSNENVVYFFATTPGVGVGAGGNDSFSFFKYTYISEDGSGSGGNWENRTSNLPTTFSRDLDQANYNQFVKVKPDDEDFVFIGTTILVSSSDGFSSSSNSAWIGGYGPTAFIYPNNHPDQHALVFFPSDAKKAINGHDGGLSLTNDITKGTDEVVWNSLNNGYFTTQAYAIAIDPITSNDNRIMAGFQDNGKWTTTSVDENATWLEEVGGGDGAYLAIVSGKDIRYTSTQNGAVARVEGANIENPLDGDHVHPSTASGQLFINPFILDKNDQNIMYYPAGEYLWRHNDVESIETGWNFNGTNDAGWSRLSGTQVSGTTITALDVSKSPANVLYYGTSNGKVYKLSNAQVSNPSNVEVTGSSFPTDAYVSCIYVDNSDANKVFVVFSNYGVKSIWYSVDGGTSWTDVSGNLEENSDGSGSGPSVRWIATSNPIGTSPTYYAGTSTGLYSTNTLNGTSTDWTQEGTTSIGNVVVSMIVTRDVDGVVVIGTHANGMYSLSGTTGSILSLSPINGSTNVAIDTEFTITFSENVTKGTGDISIKNKSNEEVISTIAVNSNEVSTSGAIATIQPNTKLPYETEVYIEFQDGTFENNSDENLPGILDNSVWTFITEEAIVVTNLDKLESKQRLKIFPNPAQSELYITLNDSSHEIGKVEVYNIQGELVIEKLLLPYNSKELSNQLDISNLSKGLYNVRVITGDFTETQKIIVE